MARAHYILEREGKEKRFFGHQYQVNKILKLYPDTKVRLERDVVREEIEDVGGEIELTENDLELEVGNEEEILEEEILEEESPKEESKFYVGDKETTITELLEAFEIVGVKTKASTEDGLVKRFDKLDEVDQIKVMELL